MFKPAQRELIFTYVVALDILGTDRFFIPFISLFFVKRTTAVPQSQRNVKGHKETLV